MEIKVGSHLCNFSSQPNSSSSVDIMYGGLYLGDFRKILKDMEFFSSSFCHHGFSTVYYGQCSCHCDAAEFHMKVIKWLEQWD